MPTENQTKTAILTGTAIVTFRKRIEGLNEQEAAELLADQESQGFQIDEDDLIDIEEIDEIAVVLE
ncbi:hypothetical protein SAMN04244579_02673 [Azotobacter beijerinckii]|uniref:Uncharacterized protein n=1 Tax=Azotobacter beijerinckii TaxID=170623 RepID=A0A1H6V0N2_9GAMM|nr:hypothetical protein [Azotobacter beijerinckii]SEI98071.1 hypothetical protein SAMN04244579_02673 [Azotobacter beijerinckii]